MKKLFILVFATLLLLTVSCVAEPESNDEVGNDNQSRPGSGRSIFIGSLEELAELQRIVLVYDDEEFYQRSQGRDDYSCPITRQFGSRDEAADFLAIVDSLTIPEMQMIRKEFIYGLGSRSIIVRLILADDYDNGIWELFNLTFALCEEFVTRSFENIFESGQPSSESLLFQNRSEGISMYLNELNEPTETSVGFLITYNDIPIFGRYVNDQGIGGGRGEFSIAEMMEGVSMVTVAELQETMAEQRAELAAQQEQATE